jgi:hypothetical protein
MFEFNDDEPQLHFCGRIKSWLECLMNGYKAKESYTRN